MTSDPPTTCPQCDSTEIHFRKSRGDWACDDCQHNWTPTAPPIRRRPRRLTKARLFLSYGRRDAAGLADRLDQDLSVFGYDVRRDTAEDPPTARTSCARSRTVSAARSSSWLCSARTPSAKRATPTAPTTVQRLP